MLGIVAILLAIAAALIVYVVRRRSVQDDLAHSVRVAGLRMLCEKARVQSSIELQAKLKSGVLVGAYKEDAELVLRERGDR